MNLGNLCTKIKTLCRPPKGKGSNASSNKLFPIDAANGSLAFSFPWTEQTARIRSWEDGCAVEAQENGSWISAPWEAEIAFFGNPYLTKTATPAVERGVRAFLRGVPEEVAAALAEYQADQFAMLRVCAATPRARRLLRDSSNLLWFVSPVLALLGKENPEIIHAASGKRKHELLELLCGRNGPLFA